LDKLEDQAILENPGMNLAFTTDSFVVDPIFFPGGNIGDLSVNGTINDIAMGGAIPKYISAAFILEEGLPMEALHRIVLSMEKSAQNAGVKIVTGDTKVVDRGSCDKCFINTSGIGLVPDKVNISASAIVPGDKIILSGTIADHGMAILTSRENLSFQSQIISDSTALNHLVEGMLDISNDIHAMRDPTRGGVATTCNEFVRQSQVGIELTDDTIPVNPATAGACEILGIDPLYVANEGKLIAAVPPEIADDMVNRMHEFPEGKNAVIIGVATEAHPGIVTITTGMGGKRIIEMPVGEQLPRIC
jgi:hydrogenase expression/formation protein HypE